MPNLGLTNLTSGELSPTMLGRADVARYGSGAAVVENFLLTTTGMYSYRGGFELMGFPKFTTSTVKLRVFKFSDQQGYILEIGEKYVRIWYTTGQVVDGSSAPIEFATDFPVSELGVLSFAQSADFLFVIHESRGIYAIERRSHTDWSIQFFQLSDGPYGPENLTTTQTLSFGAQSGNMLVTATGFATAPFGDGDQGRLIRVQDGGNWRWLIITDYLSPTTVMATLQDPNPPALGDMSAGIVTANWRLGLYSSRLGWPATGRIHEQRFVLAGPQQIPDRVDGSAVAGFNNFAPGVNGGDAYAFALGTEGVNRIIALAISNDLILLTVGTEHRLAGDSSGAAISPTTIWQKPISPDGSKRIEPKTIGNSTIFIDKYGLNIRALTYNFAYQTYAPDNLTLLADHIAWLDESSPGFQALAWQGNPIGTIWTIRGNNELSGCVYEPKENVLGWHRHPMGMPKGALGSPVVESIEILTGPTHDELWAVVRRDLPNKTLRTIERMRRPGLWDAPPESQLYLDCGQLLRNTPTADLTPVATSGAGVVFNATNVTGGFAFAAGHVGQFLKYRQVIGRNRTGRTRYQTSIAKITAIVSPTQVTADILVPFLSTVPMLAGSWGLTVATIDGLGHFEGMTIWSVSDGRVCAPQQVVNGALTLDAPGWEVSAGLHYPGYVATLPIDPGPSPVVGEGRLVRVDKLVARHLNSLGGKFAALPERDDEKMRWETMCPYKQGNAAPQAAPLPFSGDWEYKTAGAWTRRAAIAVLQDEPLPLNVQLLVNHVYAPFIQP